MTCIIMMKEGKGTIVGADGRLTADDTIMRIQTGQGQPMHKIRHLGQGTLVGMSGSGPFMEAMVRTPCKEGIRTYRQLVDWVEEYSQAFKGMSTDKDEDTYELLIRSSTGRLYRVTEPMDISEIRDYWAVGDGAMVALGTLWGLLAHKQEMDRRQMVKQALLAAGEFKTSVGPPYAVKVYY